jgi:hypothetical protein
MHTIYLLCSYCPWTESPCISWKWFFESQFKYYQWFEEWTIIFVLKEVVVLSDKIRSPTMGTVLSVSTMCRAIIWVTLAFSAYIYLFGQHTGFNILSITATPQILLCRWMLELNPGLVQRLLHWQLKGVTTELHLILQWAISHPQLSYNWSSNM